MMRQYISPRELLILIPIAALFFAALVACQPQQQTRSAGQRSEPVGQATMPADPKPADPASAAPRPEAADPGTGEAVRKEQ